MTTLSVTSTERRRLAVRGIVQGVGFRPFVYGQALRWGLGGFVLNDGAGVTIEVEGAPEALAGFEQALRAQAPPLARIDQISIEPLAPCGERGFSIAESQPGPGRATLIAADMASCADCLRELAEPGDRRYRYPFINCTNCGPRFTIVLDVPYDRERTTMRQFGLCAACSAEYHDPLSRRFHAQPNACAACGPQVRLLDQAGRLLAGDPALLEAGQQLAGGAILAIKGLGGYHLACDALQPAAVERLRQRKRREGKPFALLVSDLHTARQLCSVSAAEAELLQSRRRPIVLLEQLPGSPVAPAVAPGLATLGVMLPYTPLHQLLLDALRSALPARRPTALVLTSGNLSAEPIAYRDDDARARLLSIADGMLTHNRAIHMRCDDSVVRVAAGGPQLLRRSRGYAPEPITLGLACPRPLLACGGHLKHTFCLARGRQAFLSQHIGDLENLETLTTFRESLAHFQRLFAIQPEAVAYDLHPDYLSTQEALALDLPLKIGVQHHHAHIASVLAEHGLSGPLIGIAADGSGYGTDGAIWGCEVLIADLHDFERLAHLAYVPLPGGEQAVRQPWRMAAVYLAQAYGPDFLSLELPFVRRLDQRRWRPLAQMIARGLNSPPTSSLGRLFDAVAALLGIWNAGAVLYEGQAACELEALAARAAPAHALAPYPVALGAGRPALLDVAPLIRALVADLQAGVPRATIALRFHCSVAELLAAACLQARQASGLREVALSGGVFQNRLLLEQLLRRLEQQGFQVYLNRQVPPNDGGLSLGQAAVAAARLGAW